MVSKKRVYIAGPISKGDLLHNIRQADEAFRLLVLAGFAPFNPMWSAFSGSAQRAMQFAGGNVVIGVATQNGGLRLSHSDWLGTDLPWVEVAHAVLRLPGESNGADMETAHAIAHGIPVFIDINTLIEALK